MIQLKITLGNSFWKQFYLPYSEEYGEILPKIKKHKIVISKRIIDYYEECASNEGFKDICSTLIQDLVQFGNKCEIVRDYKQDDIKNELIFVAQDQEMKLLLAEKAEISKAKKGINLLTSAEINKNSNCILNIYTIPVTSRYVSPKEKVEKYTKWLGNWLQGEKEIIIRDKFLLEEDGIKTFKKYFLPLFEKGANIAIHTDKEVDATFLNEFNKPEYSDYLINVYKCSTMHERVIILKDFQIVIGKGISFLSWDWEMTSESFISISEITINAGSTIEKQLR